MSNGASGLYRSSNAGETFAKVANVHSAFMFSFGAPPNGSKVPTVFLYGTVENTKGIFRSDDMGTSWILINDTQYQMSDLVMGAVSMAGRPAGLGPRVHRDRRTGRLLRCTV